MEKNKFDINKYFKGKNLAIIILSVLSLVLFLCFISIASIDIDKLTNSEIENLNKTIQELQLNNENLSTEKKDLENQKSELETKIKELETNNKEQNTKIEELNKQIEELKISKENKQKEASTVAVKPQTSYSSSAETSSTYILNTNTKKFHYASCSSVSRMKDSNKREFNGTRDEVISKGYSPCQRCNP